MKKLYLLGAATLVIMVFSAYPQNSSSSIGEYRKTYTTLVEKWKQETNVVVRIELRQQIEQLKKDNLTLFIK